MLSARILGLTAVALGLVVAAPVGAQTITFDDISSDYPFSLITDEYQGLTWTNFYVGSGSDITNYSGGAGFANGVVSGTNEAFSGFSDPAYLQSATPFTSGYFTAGFSDQNVTIIGLDSLGNPIAGDSATFAITIAGPVLKTFNFPGIYGVEFLPSDHMVVDNLVLNGTSPVPEASPAASLGLLLAFGLGGLTVAKRKPRQSA